jgi:cytochrome c oxidase subunit II
VSLLVKKGRRAALVAGATVLYLSAGLAMGPADDRPAPGVREFTMTAERYAFSPDRIDATEGDTVRIVLTSVDVPHGLAIKRLQIERVLPRGEPVTVELVAGAPGVYEFVCAEYCGSGHRHMKGVLVVAPR